MGRFAELGKATVEIRAPLDRYKSDLKNAQDQTKKSTAKMTRSIDKMRLSISRVRANVLAYKFAWAATAISVLAGLKTITSAATEQERVVAQLNARIRSTGGVSGIASSELQSMASSLQKVTTFGDEAIISGQSMLLTFTKIGKDVFPRAIESALDLTTAFGGDMQSAIVQIGKALNDPIQGITALRRVGIQFTESQEDMIRQMTESNSIIGAQNLILGELETQFGGAARAARDTMGGSITALGNIVGDKFEQMGTSILKLFDPLITLTLESLEGTDGLVKSVDELTASYKNLGRATAQLQLDKINQALLNITDPKTGGAKTFFETMFAQLNRSKTALEIQLGTLTETENRYADVLQRLEELKSLTTDWSISQTLEYKRLSTEADDLAKSLGKINDRQKAINDEAEEASIINAKLTAPDKPFIPVSELEFEAEGDFDIASMRNETKRFLDESDKAFDALNDKFEAMKANFKDKVQQPMSNFFLSLIKNTKDLKGAFQLLLDAMNREIAQFLAEETTKQFFKLFLKIVGFAINPTVGIDDIPISKISTEDDFLKRGEEELSRTMVRNSDSVQIVINVGEEELSRTMVRNDDFLKRRSVGFA